MALRPGKTRIARRGMSLIEVLAALVLVGIVLPVAMNGVTVSLRAAQQARREQEAGLLAESRLNEIQALRDTTALSGAGSFDDYPDYRWEAQTAPADFGLTEVWVRVSWQQRGQERSVQLSTLVYPLSSDTSSLGATP